MARDHMRNNMNDIWNHMHQRCKNPRRIGYQHYGGRGIAVCERWHSFEAFLADMGPRPAGHSVERIDNDKGYSPENCRWATPAEQSRNRRNVIHIEHDGITDTLTGWAKRLGTSPAALHYRIRTLGISPEIAVAMPVPSRKTRHSVNWDCFK